MQDEKHTKQNSLIYPAAKQFPNINSKITHKTPVLNATYVGKHSIVSGIR